MKGFINEVDPEKKSKNVLCCNKILMNFTSSSNL